MHFHYDLSGLEEQIAKDLGAHAATQVVDVLDRIFSLVDNQQMRAKIAVHVLDGLSVCLGAVIANHLGATFAEYTKDPHWWALEALRAIRDGQQIAQKKKQAM